MSDISSLTELLQDYSLEPTVKIKAMNQLAELLLEQDVEKALYLAFDALNLAKDYKDEEDLCQSNYLLGVVKSKQRLFDEAISYLEAALPIGLKLGQNEKVANILHKLGTAYLQSGNHQKAIECYSEARDLKMEFNDETGIAEIDTNMGAIFQFKGSYALALKNYYSAIKIFEKDNLEAKIASIYNNIGIIFLEQKNYDEAMKSFNQALKIRERRGEQAAEAAVLNNIGNIYKERNEFEEALIFHQKALDIKTKLNETLGISNSLNNIGNLYLEEKKFDKAIDFLQRSLTLRQQINDKKGIVESYINLGEVYFEQQLYDKSKSFFYNALTIATEQGFKYQLQDIYSFLAKIFAGEKQYEKAYEFTNKFMEVNHEIVNLQTSHQMAQMTSRYEMEQKEREMELERVKNKELQLAYESLEIEKVRSEILLHNILPIEVANEIKDTGRSLAKHYEQVTVLFADIVGFTILSEILTPQQLIDTIDTCFKKFDDIIETHGVEKIKIIGDCYMCAGGIPVANNTNPIDVVNVGLEIVKSLEEINASFIEKNIPTISFRVGIHTGPLVSGIVGRKKFAYDIWGDTVNVAARMEQSGEPGRVNISGTTYELVKDRFECEFRGKIEAKHKGKVDMYFVNK